MDSLTLKDETEKMSRNVSNYKSMPLNILEERRFQTRINFPK
jgi:hypothetical protein